MRAHFGIEIERRIDGGLHVHLSLTSGDETLWQRTVECENQSQVPQVIAACLLAAPEIGEVVEFSPDDWKAAAVYAMTEMSPSEARTFVQSGLLAELIGVEEEEEEK